MTFSWTCETTFSCFVQNMYNDIQLNMYNDIQLNMYNDIQLNMWNDIQLFCTDVLGILYSHSCILLRSLRKFYIVIPLCVRQFEAACIVIPCFIIPLYFVQQFWRKYVVSFISFVQLFEEFVLSFLLFINQEFDEVLYYQSFVLYRSLPDWRKMFNGGLLCEWTVCVSKLFQQWPPTCMYANLAIWPCFNTCATQ